MELIFPDRIMVEPRNVKLGKRYVIIGNAGESPHDDMVLNHRGKIVTPWRKCYNQDTIICSTEEGADLWVENDGLCEVADFVEYQKLNR